jgi:hypothetical protein
MVSKGWLPLTSKGGAKVAYKSEAVEVLEFDWLGPKRRAFTCKASEAVISISSEVTEESMEVHCVVILSATPRGNLTDLYYD